LVACGLHDGTVSVVDLRTHRSLWERGSALGAVTTLCFQPPAGAAPTAARRLAAGFDDGSIALLDVRDGASMLTLSAHSRPIFDLRFSEDGSKLFSVSRDRSVRIWDGTPSE